MSLLTFVASKNYKIELYSKFLFQSNRNCCVPGYNMHGYPAIPSHGNVSYHDFPPVGDPLRIKWLINIKRLFKVTPNTVVCHVLSPV